MFHGPKNGGFRLPQPFKSFQLTIKAQHFYVDNYLRHGKLHTNFVPDFPQSKAYFFTDLYNCTYKLLKSLVLSLY